ncbi:glycosyltransferase family 32 protein [Melanomma pulvis-pyrius CBS 109.77]|uniref:Glycosyltransferase family 32 protein n=1 Tax=Melanomma pulvis-pyrius CBS 109.77 TaxID=1314802 RepID=A0A6A6XU39_9PLEO|nr:glycosyltransferase family 32 protein [Melanomma pulvis-pyrius CBS 109.77]
MLLSRRPSGLTFYASTAIVSLFAIAFLYHFWDFADRPTHAQSAPPTEIPRNLWYKLGPNGLNNQTREWTDSCIKNNPGYEFEFMTDLSADTYVKDSFAHRPEIVETYLGLTIPILKADLLRYLLLFDKGGIWSDLDISCEGPPIDEWVPQKYKSKASLVVGWEFDVGWGGNFVRQFTSWTIMAKPGLSHMSMVIDDIVEGLRNKTVEHKVSLGELTLAMTGDVVDITGPRRLTVSVLKSLELTLNKTIPLADISNLMKPKLVGDLLIMPGYSFALSSNKYGEGKAPPGTPLVTHHYAGTWKNDHGGEGG